jgi:predicted aminopeptidase
MDVLKLLTTVGTSLVICGCQLDYLAHSAYGQSKLLRARKPIDSVLADPKVSEETKRKLRLVLEVKKFGQDQLGLKENKSYLTYVALDRDSVSYVLQVAPFDELKHYEWDFPFVGKMPYKGFFDPERAKEEAKKFPSDKFDTYIRGVSAYSTLGWFRDPVLSSMLRSEDHDLIETILHETVHANLYIKNHADFNERLAMFLGVQGMKKFFLAKEGPKSPTLLQVEEEENDERLFSFFISQELDELKKWYQTHKNFSPQEKTDRLAKIQTDFKDQLQPTLKTDLYKNFLKLKLNNALLLTYQTYFYDLSDFEKLYAKKGFDYKATLEFAKTLESNGDPEKALKEAAL